MLIDSARSVKEELRLRIGSLGNAMDAQLLNNVSVGISVGKGADDYRIAIRFRGPRPIPGLQEAAVALVQTWTKVPRSEMDILYTGPVRAIPPLEKGKSAGVRVRIGSSISHFRTRAGTLGFFAEPLGAGKPGFVSANHIIAFFDDAAVGDPIVHPGGSEKNPTVGQFVRCEKLRGGGEKFVDAAFAELTTGNFDPEQLPGNKKLTGQLAVNEQVATVSKFAEGSGETHGRVRSFNFDTFQVLSYAPGLSLIDFEDQIEVESSQENRRFSEDGDSGSLVYDQDCRAVGLLFAETIQLGSFNNGLSYVNPIARVLSDLKVKLLL